MSSKTQTNVRLPDELRRHAMVSASRLGQSLPRFVMDSLVFRLTHDAASDRLESVVEELRALVAGQVAASAEKHLAIAEASRDATRKALSDFFQELSAAGSDEPPVAHAQSPPPRPPLKPKF